jgi:flagellar biosynthesis protein FliP
MRCGIGPLVVVDPDQQGDRPTANRRRLARGLWLVIAAAALFLLCGSSSAAASTSPPPTVPPVPTIPTVPPAPILPVIVTPTIPATDRADQVTLGSPAADPTSTATTVPGGTSAGSTINVNLPDIEKDSKNPILIILMLTVLSIAPSLLVLMTSFTRIVIVLSLTRNALGIPSIPPQQVIVGLSFFLTLFVMAPTFGLMKTQALDPLLAGKITTAQALKQAEDPMRSFLLKHTGKEELGLFLDASDTKTPVARADVSLTAVVPAFVLSELKTAFTMGFVIFVPFLVIDLVVSSVLMGLGMMMLPPSFVSLPFKLLLFILLDGWMLIVGMLLTSYK